MTRAYFAHETVQSSQMDCGPAALRCVLEGYGIPISFGRLREACQTGIDGTSINALEHVCQQLGLEAEQMMLPKDFLLLPEAQLFPAIAVTNSTNGGTHFVVIWRRHGAFLQIMDPAVGRRWVHRDTFRQSLYDHQQAMRASDWFAWAKTSRSFVFPLIERLIKVGFGKDQAQVLVVSTIQKQDWFALATLDAAARTVLGFKASGQLRNAKDSQRLLEELIAGDPNLIPGPYWNVIVDENDHSDNPVIWMGGAVFIHISSAERALRRRTKSEVDEEPLPVELQTALEEKAPNAAKTLLSMVKLEGKGVVPMLALVLVVQALGVMLEALLFRGFMEIGQSLKLPEMRLGAGVALVAFAAAMLLLQYPVVRTMLTLGRKLETRLRLALLEKIPKVSDRFFHGRLTGDLAERNHVIHYIRQLPTLVQNMAASFFSLILTTTGLIWLAPNLALYILFAGSAAVVIPLMIFPLLAERDMKVRALEAGLSRFYLDALQGAAPIRAHGAASAIRREYESQLTEWTRASYGLLNTGVLMRLQLLFGTALTWFIVWQYQAQASSGSMLLLVYWLLQLPVLGEQMASRIQQYPVQRNLTLRLIEILLTPEEEHATQYVTEGSSNQPVAIHMQDVTVSVGSNTILNQIQLSINPGEHVAVVGPSGAGKSSLVGLLLGWHEPNQGNIHIDDTPLNSQTRQKLRRNTAWLDPSVTLWNRTLLDNLNYGNPRDQRHPKFDELIEKAQLMEVIANQPQGFQSDIGDNGALLSGGEGQRVRLGRAFLKPNPRLAILDEAFRGLDFQTRTAMLRDARKHWQQATLIYISHDQRSALEFERVIVVDQGQIVQDGNPRELAETEGTFRNLLQAEKDVRQALWQGQTWRHLYLENGQLREEAP